MQVVVHWVLHGLILSNLCLMNFYTSAITAYSFGVCLLLVHKAAQSSQREKPLFTLSFLVFFMALFFQSLFNEFLCLCN